MNTTATQDTASKNQFLLVVKIIILICLCLLPLFSYIACSTYAVGVSQADNICLTDVSSTNGIHGGQGEFFKSIREINKQIKLLELEETVPTEMDYEILFVENRFTNKTVYLLAYAYETGNVYFKKQDKCYLVKNPEPFRENIMQILCNEGYFYSDWKIFWLGDHVEDEKFVEGGFYYSNLEFRYDRYFALPPKDISDYVYTYGNYTSEGVDNLDEMVVRLAEGIGLEKFEFYLAHDRLTNYIRAEIHEKGVHRIKALVYLDDNYNIIWGLLEE